MQLYTTYKVEKTIVSGFLLVILAGAFMLWVSNNYVYGISTKPLDALFMATSAVCVTGLATINVSSDMGLISQLVLLALVQTGGLGFMTGMMLMGLAIGRRIGIKSRIFFMGGLGFEGVHGAIKLLMTIIKYTLLIEGTGAVMLFTGFTLYGEPPATAAYYAVFHAVSAFCNAGFSTYVTGLHEFRFSMIIPGTIMTLIVLGGLGFPVFAELWACAKDKKKLSHYAHLVILITSSLIVLGTLLIFISDWNKAFAGMPVWAKIWNALFASITTRTAGFDTVAPAEFSGLGQLLMIILMIIGASPVSTGGGIKTTTFGVLAVAVWNEIRGRGETTFWHKKISDTVLRRALTLAFLYIATVLLGSIALAIIEDMPFAAIIFEAVSAMGTVGISLGITSELSPAGKLVIIALMFWGRVGILSFVATLINADVKAEIHYPEAHIPM